MAGAAAAWRHGPSRPRAPRRHGRPRPSRGRPGVPGCRGRGRPTTRQNSSQSMAPKSCWPRSAFHFRSGSGSVTPSTWACSTAGVDELLAQRVVADTRLMPQRIDCALFGDSGRPAGRTSSATATTSGSPRPAPSRAGRRCRRFIIVSRAVVALALVEALLAADAHHRAGVGRVGAAAERHLVHDRRAVDQPADGADVGPAQRRVVEDRAVLGAAGVQRVEQLVAAQVPSVSAAA